MNADKLIKSSYKIQDKWLGDYDQSTFGDEIADNDLGSLIFYSIEEAIEDYVEDRIEEYEVFKNLKKKELKSIKKSSLLTDQEIIDAKEEIVENWLMEQSCEYCFYSVRKCEDEEVFAVFTAPMDWPGSINPDLLGIFKSLDDGRKYLIDTGRYVDEMQKIYF